MFIERKLTDEFDHLIQYVSHINQLDGGTALALIVIRNGAIVTEHYEGFHSPTPNARAIQPDSQFNVASARKGYIGMAVAMAAHEGKIASIDDLVTDYLPELNRDIMARTTIRHLLTHTHGIEYDYKDNRRLYREFAVGTDWAYRGANIIMLTEIVERTMGKTVAELLQQYVFDPLGFTETGWRNQAEEHMVEIVTDDVDKPSYFELGTNTTGGGDQSNLYASAREFAYWGYLHLRKGCIDGRQVVPRAVIDMATSVQSPPTEDLKRPQNGFLWYVKERNAELSEIGDAAPAGTFQILGITGPLILAIPKHDIVVARMYSNYGNYGGPDGTEWLKYLREFGDEVMKCVEPR